MELTYGEVKQALLCCTVYQDCDACPLKAKNKSFPECTYYIMSAALNCINTMEKDLKTINKNIIE